MPRLFIDMDGVLADFDAHYLEHFGDIPARDPATGDPPGMWENIRRHGSFYRDLPPMPDAHELWEGVRHLNPTVLTGVPYHQVPGAEVQKREWLAAHLWADVPVICCKSRDKRLYGRPGDVLVDDWVRYRHLWVEMGGVFVLHASAAESVREVRRIMC